MFHPFPFILCKNTSSFVFDLENSTARVERNSYFVWSRIDSMPFRFRHAEIRFHGPEARKHWKSHAQLKLA